MTRKRNQPIYKNVVESRYICNNDSTPLDSCLLEDGFINKRAFYYTNGILGSRRKYKHGYFEARIKLPDIDGVWPSFWLAPHKGSPGNEIDIFEFNQGSFLEETINNNPSLLGIPSETVELANHKMYMTYHDWNPSTHQSECKSKTAVASEMTFNNQWHRFGLYWDNYVLIWSIDGEVAWSVYRYYYEGLDIANPLNNIHYLANCDQIQDAIDEGKQIREIEGFPDESTTIILGQGVKNYGKEYHPDSTLNQASGSTNAVFPSTYEIDWVRVWGRRACETDYIECNSDNLPSNIAARNIELGSHYIPLIEEWDNCHVIVKNADESAAYASWAQIFHSGQIVDAIATENIKLLPGFKVQTGAEFRGRISPCYGADLRSSGDNTDINHLISQAHLKATPNNSKKDTLVEANQLSIYPNPTSGILKILYPNDISNQNSTFQLFDNIGRILISNNYLPSTIDLSQYSDGIYFIEVTTDSTILRKKVVKN